MYYTIFGDIDFSPDRVATVRSVTRAGEYTTTQAQALVEGTNDSFLMPDIYEGEVVYTHAVFTALVALVTARED